ncbi:MAG: flagellar motor switch protein FliG [Limnochordaceae bacterium]|nr:flagellar motor switch protein FliG [Limnochordaceae bacterium]
MPSPRWRTRIRPHTPRRKAAVVLLMIGPEAGSTILPKLREDDVELLTQEVAGLGEVTPGESRQVLEEFLRLYQSHAGTLLGDWTSVQQLLEQSLGPERAAALLERLTGGVGGRPFSFIRQIDPQQLGTFLVHEHPQTIALVLAYLRPEQSGEVLAMLPEDVQAEVVLRLATLDRASPDVLQEVEEALRQRFTEVNSSELAVAGGVEAAAAVLNQVDGSTEKSILDALSARHPELAEEIKRRLFVFDDLVKLDNRTIQRILREVDMKDLTLALKGAAEPVTQAIFRNMSKRAVEMVKEEIQYMGPVRVRDVEEAQAKVVAVVRRLEEAGEIVVATGGEDEVIV